MRAAPIIVVASGLLATAASADEVALTPPMGWNSWNHFAGTVSDTVIRAQADAMVASGMRAAGYSFVNIDDTWEGERDAQGVIHPNAKFPDMKALADYVHGKGLKLGIYSSPGPRTCAGYEGSYGHEEQDAKTYADWGIDYLKYDLCGLRALMAKAGSKAAAHQMMLEAYRRMHAAILKTGRPMVYSLCQYGKDDVWKWGASVGGNLWRTTEDISDSYLSMAAIGFGQIDLARYGGPGHWNDPDMLEVGNGGMNEEEYRTHISLWALLAAPLLAGNDLTAMTPATAALLTNRELIAIDQDPRGIQGERVWVKGALEVWVKPLADDARAVGFFNRSDEAGEAEAQIPLAELGIRGRVRGHDVWNGKDVGMLPETLRVTIPAHGVVLLTMRSGPGTPQPSHQP
jgi:alpha-galactosidase